jgi:DNA-binding SARP family transcriptional activator
MGSSRRPAARFTVQLLGPVRAWAGAVEIDLGSARRRTLFAMLAMSLGLTVSQAEIVDGLWGDSPPGNPAGSIYTYINGLRRALDPDRGSRSSSSVLESTSPGYRLLGDGIEVDAVGFAGQVSAGRVLLTSDPAAAMVEFDAALALWGDTPLDGASGPFAQVTRLRLVELWFGLVEDRALALVTLGDYSAAAAALRGLIGDYPLRERTRGLLMQALYRAGRDEEALAVFSDVQAVLNSELGIDPSPFLRRLADRVSGRDPALLGELVQESDHAAAESASARPVPAQLPVAVSTFTGRRTELEHLRSLLTPTGHGLSREAPAIGIVSGPAGVGKTSLAVQIAHELSEYFPDGQLFVNLRSFDPHEPPVNAAQALSKLLGDLGSQVNIPYEGVAELGGHFRSLLAGKRVLIVLDNALSSEQVRPLLPGSSCAVLLTSRNRLDGLVARDGAHVLDLHPLRPADSSAFLTRLVGVDRVAGAGWELGRIAELCGHLPLALAIVARRLVAQPELGAGDVVAELSGEGDRLDALASADTDGDAIRTVFSWSYQALKPEPARLFRFLGMHPGGGISVGAAAALIETSDPDTRRLLDTLANSNLIDWAGRRYQIHDLLLLYTRTLANEEIDSGERIVATRRLFDWYLYTANNANRALRGDQLMRNLFIGLPPEGCHPVEFADRDSAVRWATAEFDTLISVTRRVIELGYDDYAWKIVAALSPLSPFGPQIGEWIELKESAAAAARREGNSYAEMWITNALGFNLMAVGRFDEASKCFTDCLHYWSTAGADHAEARYMGAVALSGMAYIFHLTGEAEKALECCHRALPVFREENSQSNEVWTLSIMGMTRSNQGRHLEAETLLSDALAKRRPPNDWSTLLLEHTLFVSMGVVKWDLGQLDEAVLCLNQALTLVRGLGDPLREVRALKLLQRVYQDLGRVIEADVSERLALSLMETFGISADAVREQVRALKKTS